MLRPRWLLALVVLTGCSGALTGRPADDRPGFYALLINGGGMAGINYLSHLHHLADMHRVLRARGLPPERIFVLASDGDSPTADVAASRPATGADAWLLQGTLLERAVGNPIRYLNTSIEGVAARRATLRELSTWFGDAGDELRAGDTVFLFVTDHGQRGTTPEDARITLWHGQSVSVRELAALLDELAPGSGSSPSCLNASRAPLPSWGSGPARAAGRSAAPAVTSPPLPIGWRTGATRKAAARTSAMPSAS